MKNELQAVYINDSTVKTSFFIDFNSTIDYLGRLIAENLDALECFQHLKGLKAVNMCNHSKDLCLHNNCIINDYFKNNDTVYFDLITMEYWIKCKMYITTNINKNKTVISLDIKVPLNLSVKRLKFKLIKFLLFFFCENVEQVNSFHFALNKATIKLISGLKDKLFSNKYLDDLMFKNSKF